MIKVVKLITGEILIGDVQETEKHLVISDYFNIIPTEKGVTLVAIDKYFSDESRIEINPSAVVSKLKPAKNLETGYLSRKSGIDLTAAKSPILS